jgi:hypothetical protein
MKRKLQHQFRQGDVLVERVDFDPTSKPHKAVAWTFGKGALDYAPSIET